MSPRKLTEQVAMVGGGELTPIVRRDGRDMSIVSRLERLHVAVVSDCLDSVGLRSNVLDNRIGPLFPGARAAGYAATVHIVAVDDPPADAADNYRAELAAVDALQPGDVMVVGGCRRSYWGELLSTAARGRGAHGIVADAYTRDSAAIEKLGFPTFVAGIQAQDSLGRVEVSAYGIPVDCGGVRVDPGDLILADRDGVVVVPHDVAGEVVDRAESKVATEAKMRRELSGGMPIGEAFTRFGIL